MQDVAYKFYVILFHFVKYSQHAIILYCLEVKLEEASLIAGR